MHYLSAARVDTVTMNWIDHPKSYDWVESTDHQRMTMRPHGTRSMNILKWRRFTVITIESWKVLLVDTSERVEWAGIALRLSWAGPVKDCRLVHEFSQSPIPNIFCSRYQLFQSKPPRAVARSCQPVHLNIAAFQCIQVADIIILETCPQFTFHYRGHTFLRQTIDLLERRFLDWLGNIAALVLILALLLEWKD